MDAFLNLGLAIDGLRSKFPTGNLKNLNGFKRQSGLDIDQKSIEMLDALEKQGVKFISVAKNKIPIGQIRARVKDDLEELRSKAKEV